ncbi:hypothetical protein AQ505_11380 [Pedobacter sp. PACM 27299]|uniref:hypothetical protein n=1 Tax=Pedobacter sp. PACM 27299 TaxID=1727164 RepID=UPI0007062327|nr:hypothetical protein [Pedobacter sp. PACM 27299]ALL06041.1 hypothetical protein AQ505_11380 [Pedobacter sp. PACM 27299]
MITAQADAQQKDPSAIGQIKGVVRDSLHNFSLQSATISIYSKADSSLLMYQLANRLGEFVAKNIPIGKPLYADFTYLGYKGQRRYFTISLAEKIYDFKTIYLRNQDVMLQEVAIGLPPVRMNRDTLEFLADAYTLEKSATVEDLLRKLAGLTVWGDGSITYNGKPIHNLTVNGKPFFGGTIKVATQNLPKNIVDKIQVFNNGHNENPLDSTLQMNVKLKKGMENGLFGKVSAGYGTAQRYGADASISHFTPKLQLGILTAFNNTNKVAGSVSGLQQYSSFKGAGTSNEYSSDFSRAGLNRQYAGGAQFQYNFMESKKTLLETRLLTGDYFASKDFNQTEREIVTDRLVSQGIDTRKIDANSNRNTVTRQHLNLNYQANDSKNGLVLAPKVIQSITDHHSITNSTVLLPDGTEQSSNESQNINSQRYNFYGISGKYNMASIFSLSFDFSNHKNDEDRTNITEFTSPLDVTQNKAFNRKYAINTNSNYQMINLRSMPLQDFIFDKRKMRPSITLRNKIELRQNQSIDQISDLNADQNNYTDNTYLSNRTKYNLTTDVLGLNINRSYDVGSLAGRYQRNLRLNIDLQNQFLWQEHRSEKAFQNIKRDYSSFVPLASIHYEDYQTGSYSKSYRLSYISSITVPEIQQFAPLVDSSNVYIFYRGNTALKESYHHELVFDFSHVPSSLKDGINYTVSAHYKAINNYITDSVFYDELGRQTIGYVNVMGYRSAGLNSQMSRSYKFSSHQVQLRLNVSYNFSRRPGYTNGLENLVQQNSTSGYLDAGYSFKDKLLINLGQRISNSNAKNRSPAAVTAFVNTTSVTTGRLSFPFYKGLTFASNVDFNHYKSSSSKAVSFTIWNAGLTQRFTEEKNFELRFEALDLLRQNKNMVIINDGTMLTSTRTNTLTQYFMLSFSYFPRRFGNSKK